MSLLLDLTNIAINDTFPDLPKDEIRREYLIDTMKRYLDSHDVLFVEGENGVGKTVLLAQFVKQYPYSAISYFITPSIKFTYSALAFKNNIYRQLYFYLNNTLPTEDIIGDDNFINKSYPALLRKLRRSKSDDHLYFVFDSLNDIGVHDLTLLNEIISNLPWLKAKFIFSGSQDKLESLLPSKIRFKHLPLHHFSIQEAKDYFKDLTRNEEQLREIYGICSKGLPEKLSQVKRLCIEMGSVENFLSEEVSEKTNLFELEWSQLSDNKLQQEVLSIIAFDESTFSTEKLATILKQSPEAILAAVNNLSFLQVQTEKILFISENYKKFAQTKLSNRKQDVFDRLIEYYENTPYSEESLYNLPSIYQKAKKWQEVLRYLSLDAFVNYIEKSQSLSSVKRQFDYGFDAAKQFSKFNSDYLRFALYKSSTKQLNRNDNWEVELEARVVIGQYEEAYLLAKSAFLKEDRLRLLALMVKKQKENKIVPQQTVIDEIKDLYQEVDYTLLKEKAVDLASILLYSCPELAIELVEKVEASSKINSSVDMAFAYLSMFAHEANKNTNTKIADENLFKERIKDNELQNLADGFKFFSDEHSTDGIIDTLEKISNINQRIHLLRRWLRNNKDKKGVARIVEYAMNKLIVGADEGVPNASILSDFATPLTYIKEEEELKYLVSLFDSQKSTITTPTKNFIDLQLTIAEALYPFEKETTKDRIFELFLLLDEIKDLSIQTDCLCKLWVKLKKIDPEGEIEKELSTSASLDTQIKTNLLKLLEDTAYHSEILESIIKVVTPMNPSFVENIIDKTNIQQNRDRCYLNALIVYLKEVKIDQYDYGFIRRLYTKMTSINYKEYAVFKLVNSFYINKEAPVSLLSNLRTYTAEILDLNVLEGKCYTLILTIKVLNRDKDQYEDLIKKFLEVLESSWNSLDVLWEKIDIGFKIARDIFEFSPDIAKTYLNNSTAIRDTYNLSSPSTASAYLTSIQIVIKSLSGLMTKVKDFTNHLAIIQELINQVKSNGEQLKLWNIVALELIAHKRLDDFYKVVKTNIRSLYLDFARNKNTYLYDITVDLAPTFFYSDAREVFFEKMDSLPLEYKTLSMNNVLRFIMSKNAFDEYQSNSDIAYNLEYDECVNLCTILNHLESDGLIYDNIKSIVFCLKTHRLPPEQRNDIKRRLNSIIDAKLPNKTYGVNHNGYAIIAKAEVLSLENYNKKEWEDLLEKARNIPNISDKAFVFIILSNIINPSNKSLKIETLEEGLKLTNSITSNFEKERRFSFLCEICLKVAGKTYFEKIAKEGMAFLLSDKDGNTSGIQNLIDVAQKHDTKLAEHMVTLIDQNPSRKKLKSNIEKQIEKSKKLKNAKSNFKLLPSLNTEELKELALDNLVQLSCGRYTSKEISDTLSLLDRISKLPLQEAYDLISYFIQNAIKKYQNSEKQLETLDMIFKATVDNARLLEILSMDSVTKMRNRFKYAGSEQLQSNPIIRPGDRDDALNYLRSWILDNIQNDLLLIDPYFSEQDLDFIQLIQDINSSIQVTILTSKENGLNSHENNELEYNQAWKKLSAEMPPETVIHIVWISGNEKNKKSPFHDRWLIGDEHTVGLKLGTSYNSLGLSKDSQLSHMSEDEIFNVKHTVINDFLIKRERRYHDYKLHRSNFDLLAE